MRPHADARIAGWERIGARYERAATLLLMQNRTDDGRSEMAEVGVVAPVQQ